MNQYHSLVSNRRIVRGLSSVMTALALVASSAILIAAPPAAPAHAADANAFVSKHAAWAQASQSSYGIPASITLAQAALESGWATSELAVNANNYFGIKCSTAVSPYQNGCYTKVTKEWVDGKYVDAKASFRKYASPRESFLDHSLFLKKDRYAKAFQYPNDPRKFITEIWKGGYATDPGYPDKIMNLISRYNLTKYDLQPAATSTPTPAKTSAAPKATASQPSAPKTTAVKSSTAKTTAVKTSAAKTTAKSVVTKSAVAKSATAKSSTAKTTAAKQTSKTAAKTTAKQGAKTTAKANANTSGKQTTAKKSTTKTVKKISVAKKTVKVSNPVSKKAASKAAKKVSTRTVSRRVTVRKTRVVRGKPLTLKNRFFSLQEIPTTPTFAADDLDDGVLLEHDWQLTHSDSEAAEIPVIVSIYDNWNWNYSPWCLWNKVPHLLIEVGPQDMALYETP